MTNSTKKKIKLALVGQPNVGKSLLINALCDANMRVGNFAGVTVEKAEAVAFFKDYQIEIIDLPGTYSLHGYSEEEKVTRSFLQNGTYDLVLNIVDATNLSRNLLLTTQLLESEQKFLMALNMADEAQKEGINIDTQRLTELFNVPCVLVSANTKFNLTKLLELIVQTHEAPKKPNKRIFDESIESEVEKLCDFIQAKNDPNLNAFASPRALAISLLRQEDSTAAALHDKAVYSELCEMVNLSLKQIYISHNTFNIKAIFMSDSVAFVEGAIRESVRYETPKERNKTPLIDRILINKWAGIPIFLLFMWLLFQLTFTLGDIPMGWIEKGYTALGEWVKEVVPNETLSSIIADGAINGVGAVLLFLPNIIILFLGIALLETTGYMARVAFLLDGFFHKFGLHGKSFIPLVTGFGCSVPAFMATRMLKNRKDRLLTLFIINFMSCGARLPVYVLFVGALFSKESAGNWLFCIYIFGALVGLVLAKILRLTAFRGADEPFVMEMPKYRMPSFRLVWFMVWNKAKMYLKKAGTFILAASLLVWFASNFGADESVAKSFDAKIESTKSEMAANSNLREKEMLKEMLSQEENARANALLEASYLGQAGKFLEPVFSPLGFDWRLSVSLVSGLAAKEVMISTMGVLYSLGGEEDEESEGLSGIIKTEIPFSTAIAYVLFVMFYNPCLAATTVFSREAGGWKYAGFLFLLSCGVAYLMAFVAKLVL